MCRAWDLVDGDKVPCGEILDKNNSFLCSKHIGEFNFISTSSVGNERKALECIIEYLNNLKYAFEDNIDEINVD